MDDLKIGDTVVVKSDFADHLRKITGETKLCWKVDKDTLYYKDTCIQRRAGVWSSTFISLASVDDIKRINEEKELRKIVSTLFDTNWKKVEYDKLHKVYEILNNV